MWKNVESFFGKCKYLCIYLISGICGSVLSMTFNTNALSVGASGAIYGIIGSYLLLIVRFYGFDGLTQMIRPIISMVVMSMLPGIDGKSHFSCMAVGMAITYLLIIMGV